ncbi:HdeD family acid-resistance protein [Galbibacter sp. BG1]|uniref:HdeD family acid-resistance protein n=1 Tax=Galbibacter sp. BG1 TaxID=1170699 RepID=UPI0015C16DA0|nr:HdeD family acid-resistance protein [Galbibacter sp. BG1]QLE00378.1 HdeD family acid-resistance protein [Galbibacter sp. BG1]
MLQSLMKHWWALALRGLLLIIFALLIFANPLISAATLAIWFAIIMVVDGIFSIIGAIASWKEQEDKWLILIEGIISIVLGIILFQVPQLTLLVIAYTIAFWFIFLGVSRIAMGIQVRKEIEGEGWIILGGALSVILGIVIIAMPIVGISSVMWLIAFTALIVGIVMIVIALKIRKGGKWIKHQIEEIDEDIKEARENLKN